MKFTDTHCHLAEPALRQNLDRIIREARACGVWRFLVPATCRRDWRDVADLSLRPSENIRIALGIHPWFTEETPEQDLAELESLLRCHPQAWVGEIGLDFYDKNQTAAQRECQQKLFVRQLVLAESLKRRVVVHNLKSSSAAAAAIAEAGFGQGGIIHAFSGSAEEASAFVRLGFKIGIGALLLNPSARKIRKVVQALDLCDMVLETDSPFMLKNEVNTPANVRRIAETVAQLRGIAVEEVAAQTERNADGLLEYRKGLPDEPELI